MRKIMFASWSLLWITFIKFTVLKTGLSLGSCLPSAIPPEQRQLLNVDGEVMPLSIWLLQWDTGYLTAKIFKILSEEVLGFVTVEDPGSDTGESVFFQLAGCKKAGVYNVPDADCFSGEPTRQHVVLEMWKANGPEFVAWLRELGPQRPLDMGLMGYDGAEGMYVRKKAVDEAIEKRGLPLNIFYSYNSSWHKAGAFFALPSQVDSNRLRPCTTTRLNQVQRGVEYLKAIPGDIAGTEQTAEGPTFKCWDDHWWYSPACRSNPNECVPVITGSNGWGIEMFAQKAAFFNMPLALAVGKTWGDYLGLVREFDVLAYWWEPDVNFLQLELEMVHFPAHDPDEYKAGLYPTQGEKAQLSKWAFNKLPSVAPRIHALLAAMTLSSRDVKSLLVKLNKSGNYTESACSWLKENQAKWASWIPDTTTCFAGQGIVDASGSFVLNRSAASSCQFCSAGRSSEELPVSAGDPAGAKPTFTCVTCPLGRTQAMPGMKVCDPCFPGTYAGPAQRGLICHTCEVGRYTNISGASECTRCGAKAISGELWSTRKAITLVEKSVEWVPVEGAASEELCGCRANSWQGADGECRECEVQGSLCDGSGTLRLQPGFYSAAQSPDHIFRCFGSGGRRCPGGAPGTCATGRDNASITCADCEDGLTAGEGGECIECQGGQKVLVPLAVVAAILLCWILYKVMTMQGAKGKLPGSQILVSITIGQFATWMRVWQRHRRDDDGNDAHGVDDDQRLWQRR